MAGTKKRETPRDPNRGREVLQDLLMEAEMEAELERMGRLPPEQLDEESRSEGIPPGWGAQLLARASAQVDAQRSLGAGLPERSVADQLDDLIDEDWVRHIGTMSPAEIKALAAGRDLTDDQAEAILRRAKERIAESEDRRRGSSTN